MSDARWLDVDDDLAAAERHFANAVTLYADGGFDEPGLAGYRNAMAFMHALQSAHTSAEMAMLRILTILDEQPPSGEDWHQKLIARLAKGNGGGHARPAVLSPTVASDLDETRRFRNRATRSYGSFDPSKETTSVDAASRLASSLSDDIALFRRRLDPEAAETGRKG